VQSENLQKRQFAKYICRLPGLKNDGEGGLGRVILEKKDYSKSERKEDVPAFFYISLWLTP
jgi:hypothetical protein